ALVCLARGAQLSRALPGEPGLIELARPLVELRHVLETTGLHVQLHQELPPLALLQQGLGFTRGELGGQPARGVVVLGRERRPECRAQVASGLEEPRGIGEGAVLVVEAGGVACPSTRLEEVRLTLPVTRQLGGNLQQSTPRRWGRPALVALATGGSLRTGRPIAALAPLTSLRPGRAARPHRDGVPRRRRPRRHARARPPRPRPVRHGTAPRRRRARASWVPPPRAASWSRPMRAGPRPERPRWTLPRGPPPRSLPRRPSLPRSTPGRPPPLPTQERPRCSQSPRRPPPHRRSPARSRRPRSVPWARSSPRWPRAARPPPAWSAARRARGW